MFIGREKELKMLEEMYSSLKFEFLVLYGRRRVENRTFKRIFKKQKSTVLFGKGTE